MRRTTISEKHRKTYLFANDWGAMRATVEFDLPEEWDELRQHLGGPDAIGVLWAIDNHLRNVIKHGPGGHIGDALQTVRNVLHEECSSRGITLD